MSQDETSYLRMDGLWQRGELVFDGLTAVTPFVSRLGRLTVQIDASHERELKAHGGKLATHETWAKYSNIGHKTALWRAIALLCCADPADWSLEEMQEVSFCRWRLEMAVAELGRALSLIRTSDTNPNPAKRVVRFDMVRDWCQRAMIPVPWFYPDCFRVQIDYDEAAKPAPNERDADAPPEIGPANPTSNREPKTEAPRRARASRPNAPLLREAELLEMLPFSRATLWRRIKGKQFPEPVQLSPGVTAWVRADIESWLEQQASPAAQQAGKGRRRKS